MPADLAIEIGEVALDEERLQTLPAGEVTQRRRPDAGLGRGRMAGTGTDRFARDRQAPIAEHHRQRSGTAILARDLADRRHAVDPVPAVVPIREVRGRGGPRSSVIAAARQDTAGEHERSDTHGV